jgi:DNA-binding NarL/FixJ family response regulator
MKHTAKVLIVEDNPGVRRLLRRAIAELTPLIWECDDGSEAQAAYEAYLPDVVLMDIRMRVVDGLTATKRILRAFPLARIVMVTDYDDDALRSAAQKAGACGYVLKQNLTELAGFVASILDHESD